MLKRFVIVVTGVWFVAMILTGLSRPQRLQWEDVIIGAIPFCVAYLMLVAGRWVVRG